MKEKIYARMGSLVMALVFTMVLAGCPMEDTSSGNKDDKESQDTKSENNDDNQSQSTKGLTITDIPTTFNGMYLLTKSKDSAEPHLVAAESVDEKSRTISLTKISSGKAEMSIWEETKDTATPYTGSDKGVEFVEVFIFRTRNSFSETDWNSDSMEDMFKFLAELGGVGKTTVDFTNGVGTGKFIKGSISDLMGGSM